MSKPSSVRWNTVHSCSNLGEGAALTNSDEVTEGNVTESGGNVGAEVLVALLETLVLRDEVEVVTADDACADIQT